MGPSKCQNESTFFGGHQHFTRCPNSPPDHLIYLAKSLLIFYLEVNARQLVFWVWGLQGKGGFHVFTFSSCPCFQPLVAPPLSHTYHLQVWSLSGPLVAQLAPSLQHPEWRPLLSFHCEHSPLCFFASGNLSKFLTYCYHPLASSSLLWVYILSYSFTFMLVGSLERGDL